MHQPDTHAAPSFVDGFESSPTSPLPCDYRNWFDSCGWVALSMIFPYVEDLISYHAIGARSVEDQEHRFVSNWDLCSDRHEESNTGNLSVMFNAIYAAQHPKTFCSMPKQWNIRKSFSSYDPSWDWMQKLVEYSKLPLWRFASGSKNAIAEMGLQHPFILVDANMTILVNNSKSKVRIVEKPWWMMLGTRIGNFSSWFHDWILSRRWSSKMNQWFYGQSITDPCPWVGKKHRPWSKEIATMNRVKGRGGRVILYAGSSKNGTETINKDKNKMIKDIKWYRIDRFWLKSLSEERSIRWEVLAEAGGGALVSGETENGIFGPMVHKAFPTCGNELDSWFQELEF